MIADASAGEAISLDFQDFPISAQGVSLGTSDAEARNWVAENQSGNATVNIVLDDFEWGTYQDEPVCVLQLSIYPHGLPRVLKFVKLEILSLAAEIDGGAYTTSPVQLVTWRPIGEYGHTTYTPVAAGFQFAPRVEVLNNGFEVGDYHRDQERLIPTRCTIEGSPCWKGKAVQFSITENRELDGVPHHVRVFSVFRHHNEPFLLSFKVEGKTGAVGEVVSRFLKRTRNDDIEKRIFRPLSSRKQFTDAILDDLSRNGPHQADPRFNPQSTLASLGAPEPLPISRQC